MRMQACICDGRQDLSRVVFVHVCQLSGSIIGVQGKSGRRLLSGPDSWGRDGKYRVRYPDNEITPL